MSDTVWAHLLGLIYLFIGYWVGNVAGMLAERRRRIITKGKH